MRLLPATFGLIAMTGSLAAAEPQAVLVTPWTKAASSEARLILPSVPAAGNALAGIEIRLPAGAKTYWRSAGETGVPPTFDFSASRGLGALTALYPAPTAFDDGAGGVAFGYIEHVVFPIRLQGGVDGVLKATVDYGVCLKNMCVPARAELSGTPGDGVEDAGAAAALAQALAAVPEPVPLHASAPRAIRSVTGAITGDTAKLTIDATGAAADSQLFLEADDTFAVKRALSANGAGRFEASAQRSAEAPAKPWGKALITLRTPGGAIETPIDLDAILKR